MLWGNNVAYTNICPGLYLFNPCGGDVPIVKQYLYEYYQLRNSGVYKLPGRADMAWALAAEKAGKPILGYMLVFRIKCQN